MSHFKDNNKVFWLGVNGMEYISWENSRDIIEYDPYFYPIPTSAIHYNKAIKSEEDMYEALGNGDWYGIDGKLINNPLKRSGKWSSQDV